MTAVAAGLWFASPLLRELWKQVDDLLGLELVDALTLLTWVVVWAAVALTLACWLEVARSKLAKRETGRDRDVQVRESAELQFAKKSSLVAAILVAFPIALWAYQRHFPPDCIGEYTYCLAGPVFLAIPAPVGILVALLGWLVYLARGRRPGDRFFGLWTQVLALDVAVYLIGAAAEDRQALLMLAAAGVAYIAFSVTRRHRQPQT